MKSTLHERRVEQEWRLLQTLAGENRPVLEVLDRKQEVTCDLFSLVLRQTCGLVKHASELKSLKTHAVVFRFPQFFPSVPIEASLVEPVFHPNVHPVTGFVCLWNRFSAGDTIVEAVARLQRVVAWQLMNVNSDHLLQPESIAWYGDPQRTIQLPLSFQAVLIPKGFRFERSYALRPTGNYRRRLA